MLHDARNSAKRRLIADGADAICSRQQRTWPVRPVMPKVTLMAGCGAARVAVVFAGGVACSEVFTLATGSVCSVVAGGLYSESVCTVAEGLHADVCVGTSHQTCAWKGGEKPARPRFASQSANWLAMLGLHTAAWGQSSPISMLDSR